MRDERGEGRGVQTKAHTADTHTAATHLNLVFCALCISPRVTVGVLLMLYGPIMVLFQCVHLLCDLFYVHACRSLAIVHKTHLRFQQ
jgi:hypothetical protein